MTFRSARAGTELSTEFWSFRVVTFSIRGAMRLLGILPTKGPRLVDKSQRGQEDTGKCDRAGDGPFDSLVLYLTVLVVQSLHDVIDGSSGGVVVMV